MHDNIDPKRALSPTEGQHNVRARRGTLIEVPEPIPFEQPAAQAAGPVVQLELRNKVQVGTIAPGAIPRGKNSPPRKMEKPQFLSITLDEEDKNLLAKLALKRGVSISTLTRQAIKDFLSPLRKNTL